MMRSEDRYRQPPVGLPPIGDCDAVAKAMRCRYNFDLKTTMNMNRLCIPAIVVAAGSLATGTWFLWASFDKMSSVSVSDVRQGETLVLGTKTGSHHTHGVTIRGSGEIEGDATISLLLNGEPYKAATLNGRIDFEWGGDWYSETAEVRYEPADVRAGEVVLHYRFHQ